jgi:hypothetical protein
MMRQLTREQRLAVNRAAHRYAQAGYVEMFQEAQDRLTERLLATGSLED